MRILLVSDAWSPQVNGVVRTLERVRQECLALGHTLEVIAPDQFRTVPCPSYPEIRLALRPGRRLAARLESFRPDAVHIATEGPLGLAAGNASSAACRSRPPTTPAFRNTSAPDGRCRSSSAMPGCAGSTSRPRA